LLLILFLITPKPAQAIDYDLTGQWNWTDTVFGLNFFGTAEINHEGATLTFTWKWQDQNTSKWVGAGTTFDSNLTLLGSYNNGSLTAQWTGTILDNGNKIQGTWKQSNGQTGTFVATKIGPLSSPFPSPTPSPSPSPSPSPIVTPFLDLPWDYEGQGKSFEQVALDPFSWFDHEYPLQNIPCCVQRVMKYTGETENDFYRSHNGYDYASQNGVFLNTPVLAAASGWATYVSWEHSNGAGNVIKIDHENGYQTWYEHLGSECVLICDENQKVFVNNGEVIGKVGMTGNTTGPHIHFSVFKDTDGDKIFDDEIPYGVTDPLGWDGEPNQDPWSEYKFEGNPDDETDDRTGTASFNLFIPRSQPVSNIIPVTGGTLSTDKVDISVPDGASDNPFDLFFKNGPFESASDLIQSVGPSFFLNAISNIGQAVTEFLKPIQISYDYSNANLSNINEDTLQLYSFNEQTGNWDPIPTILDQINNIATGDTLHFSQFALMGEVKDLISPTTSVEITGDKRQGNWYRSNVTVELNGQDNENGIGLQYTLYTLNGNDWLEYTQPLIFENEGHYEITYQSYDKAENTEERASLAFNIDKTLPTVNAVPDRSADNNDWYNQPVTISFTGTDAESGIEFCTNPVTYDSPDNINATVGGTCTDKAGNIGSGEFDFKYDVTLPKVYVSVNPTYIWPPNGKTVDVIVTCSCSDSYLNAVNLIIDDEYNLYDSTSSINPNFTQTVQLEAARDDSDLDGRLYIIKVVAEDLAGNKSQKQIQVIVPHDQGKNL